MPLPSRGRALRWYAALLLVAFTAVGAWVAIVGDLPGDRRALVEIHQMIGDELDKPMRAITEATDLWALSVVSVVVVVVLAVRRRGFDAVSFAVAVGVVWLLNPALKRVFARDRPDVRALPEELSEYTFPSGHAAGSAALTVAIVMVASHYTPRSRVTAMLFAAFAAFAVIAVVVSQLVLARHYPSDLLAGLLWASGWVLLVWSLRDSVRRRVDARRARLRPSR